MYSKFEEDIARMNQVYELAPVELTSWAAMKKRIEQFTEILDKECTEIDDIDVCLNQADDENYANVMFAARIMLADLLGDLIVYCASEAKRWNIPLNLVLSEAIMPSNFSKLGEDGKPIKNPVTDKFEKGPNYWKPEPKIGDILIAWDQANERAMIDPGWQSIAPR